MNKIITTEFERISVEKMLNIDSKYRKYWVVSDRDVDDKKHLVIVSYIGNNDSISDLYVSMYRGYILDIKNNVIVSKSFGMPDSYGYENLNDDYQKNKISKDLIFYKGKEGVSLRIYNYMGKTYISTHRKLNFHNSIFRPNITFSEMFNSFENSNISLENIVNHCKENNNNLTVFLYMVHPMLAIADTNSNEFGIYFFCIQDRSKNYKNDFEYPSFLNKEYILEQNKLNIEKALSYVSNDDIYDRNSSSILIVDKNKTYVCMSKAFEFRKNILGEEQTLYPSFVKRVFELKKTNKNNFYLNNKYYSNTDTYQRNRPIDKPYAEYIYEIYNDICPDSLKSMLKIDNLNLNEKYSLDYKESFNWIRKNPDSIIEHCKENRVSVYLAKLRKTQNFLKLEDYVFKNCTPEQFYSIITDYKRAKHMTEKIEKELNEIKLV